MTALPLVPEVLYRVGTSVRAENLSWVSPGFDGYDALSCYVFDASDEVIFVDAGAAVSRPAVTEALEQIAGSRRRTAYVTRTEGENIGNLPDVLSRPGSRLLFGLGGGVLEWIHDADEENFIGRVELVPATNGTSWSTESGLHFHWMDAPIKQMFLTQWAYEERTRTLFTSDMFAWHHLAGPDERPVVTWADAVPPAPAVAEAIARRVNWLVGATFPARVELLESVFATYDVERLAPCHGSVIEGREAVERTLAVTLDALGLLSEAA